MSQVKQLNLSTSWFTCAEAVRSSWNGHFIFFQPDPLGTSAS